MWIQQVVLFTISTTFGIYSADLPLSLRFRVPVTSVSTCSDAVPRLQLFFLYELHDFPNSSTFESRWPNWTASWGTSPRPLFCSSFTSFLDSSWWYSYFLAPAGFGTEKEIETVVSQALHVPGCRSAMLPASYCSECRGPWRSSVCPWLGARSSTGKWC